MKSRTRIPVSIKIVAFIFIAIGLLTFANILLALYNFARPSLGALSVLAVASALIFCASVVCLGIGLMRLSPKSWDCALAVVWIIMGLIACLVVLISVTPSPGYLWQGEPLTNIPIIPGVLLGLVIFAVFYWKYRVLICSKNRRLFYPQEN